MFGPFLPLYYSDICFCVVACFILWPFSLSPLFLHFGNIFDFQPLDIQRSPVDTKALQRHRQRRCSEHKRGEARRTKSSWSRSGEVQTMSQSSETYWTKGFPFLDQSPIGLSRWTSFTISTIINTHGRLFITFLQAANKNNNVFFLQYNVPLMCTVLQTSQKSRGRH